MVIEKNFPSDKYFIKVVCFFIKINYLKTWLTTKLIWELLTIHEATALSQFSFSSLFSHIKTPLWSLLF